MHPNLLTTFVLQDTMEQSEELFIPQLGLDSWPVLMILELDFGTAEWPRSSFIWISLFYSDWMTQLELNVIFLIDVIFWSLIFYQLNYDVLSMNKVFYEVSFCL